MTDFDDDPLDPASVAAGAAVAEALRASSTTAALLVNEHEKDFDEILSTVLLGAIGRWYWSVAGRDDAEGAEVMRAAHALDELYAAGDDLMETVIATGFLEALPHPGEPGRDVVERLPTNLREELRRMEEWRPSTGNP